MYIVSNSTDAFKYCVVDMRSDTVTKPTPLMRKAMAEADVGDDVYGEDPTVNELEKRAANIFGKEAALFAPTGTMSNLIAIMVHCDTRSCELLTGDLSHVFLYEQSGASQLAGVQITTLKNNIDGTFDLVELKNRIRGFTVHESITKLVCIENTHCMCGGKVLPLSWITEVSKICRENGLALHMDGARIFHAAEFLKVPVAEIVKYVDSVNICLSKALSTPIGSLLIGTQDFITKARRCRKVLGGAMRQIGVIAATGLVALDTVVPGLGETHTFLHKIASAIHRLNSSIFIVDIENVQTNILLISLENSDFTAGDFVKRLSIVEPKELETKITDTNGNGIVVKSMARDNRCIRIVVHPQITAEDVNLSIKKVTYVIREFEGNR